MKRSLFLLAAALAAAASVSAETPEEEIRRAIAQLGDEDPKKRDAAEELLRDIGPEAALLYRPDDQGKTFEIRRRMRALMEEWGYTSVAEISQGSQGRCRLDPWEEPAAVPVDLLGRVEDDRLRDYLAAGSGKDPRLAEWLLARGDLPPRIPELRSFLDRAPTAAVTSLDWRGDLEPEILAMPELHRAAVVVAGSGGEESEPACRILLSLGDLDEVIRAVRGGKVARPAFGQCVPRGEKWEVLLAAMVERFGEATVAPSYPNARFIPYYVDHDLVSCLAQLDHDVAEIPLRTLLRRDPGVRLRAAIVLNAWEIPVGGLGDFDDATLGLEAACLPGPVEEAFIQLAPRLAGDRPEVRLRRLCEGRSHPDWLLGALAARRRPRDITFVYSRLKDMIPARQPAGAVWLARLGSAAGVGILIPHLLGTDFEIRKESNQALRAITGQDFSYDPAGTLPARCRAARKWAAWWRENKATFHPEVK